VPPSSRRFRFYLYCRQQGLWPKEVGGIDPHNNSTAFDPFCPIRNVTGEYPPTLLLHGDKDTDVPFEQSRQKYNVLKQHGVECEFIPVEGGGHGFDAAGTKDPQVVADFDRVIAFLRKHLESLPGKSEERLIAVRSGQSRSDRYSLTPHDVAGNKPLR
jgi:dipeptidyl aminopeptidase/acylaminoacyl peptidase